MKTRSSPPEFKRLPGRHVSRRDFLRWTSYGLVIIAAPSLGGCGSGGGGSEGSATVNNPPPAGGNSVITSGTGTKGTPVSETLRASTFSSVQAEFDRLVGSGTRFDPTAMVAFLSQQPAFHEVGYTPASDCAWAIFTDGRKLMLINSVDPSTATVPPVTATVGSAQAQAIQIPGLPPAALSVLDSWEDPERPKLVKPQFRLINMWENAHFWTVQPLMDYLHVTQGWVDADTIPGIGRIANGLGFDLIEQGVMPNLGFTVDRSRIGEVEELLSISGDGVFFLTGSAGYFNTSEENVAAICTSTRRGQAIEGSYETDFANGALCYAMARDHLDPGSQTYLAFTPQFTRNHSWSFPEESLVFLNVTGGGIGQWLDAMLAAGAGLIMGWEDAPQQRTMLGVAQDFFELALATNRIGTDIVRLQNEPRLRSYGVGVTQDFLSRHHLLDTDTGNGVKNHMLRFPGATRPYIAQLRPSIEWITVVEDLDELLIQGQFGDDINSVLDEGVRIGSDTREIRDPNSGALIPELDLVADKPLDSVDGFEILEWRPFTIRVRGKSKSGRETGMVQVWQAKRYSNIVHLTRWKIPFQITRTVGGRFQRSVTMEVSIRAFVSGYRLWPDQDLRELWPMTSAISSPNGLVGWSASGSESQTISGETTTIGWSGAGNFSVSEMPLRYFRLEGMLLVNAKQLDCSLAMGVANGLIIRTTTSEGTIEVPVDFDIKTPAVEPGFYPNGLPKTGAFSIHFDDSWRLLAGSIIFPDTEESTPFSNNSNCETQIIWSDSVPEFPPEMNRGGR